MNLRQLLNRPKKPIKPMEKLIYITNSDIFFDRAPIDPKLQKHPSYNDIKRFAIIDESIECAGRSYLKNPFWLGHSGEGQDDNKYPGPIRHFWQVNSLKKIRILLYSRRLTTIY